MQKNHAARRGAGIEIGSSRRRCGVWRYNKKQASSEKIPGTLLYNWQAVLCTTSQSASQTRPGCGSQRLLRCRSHPAGRGPNSSSLFPPLAAVVAVAPRGRGTGEPGRPTLDEQSFFILKTAVPCYRGQQLRNNILVKLLLISVAGHSFLRYIKLSAVSLELSGLPMAPPLGELSRLRRD